MANFRFDQAEGLRRMVAGPRPRMLSVLSAATPGEKTALLVNLAAALHSAGASVLLLDAASEQAGVAQKLGLQSWSLAQAAQFGVQAGQEQALLANRPEGFALGALGNVAAQTPQVQAKVLSLFNRLAESYELVLVDADANAQAESLRQSGCRNEFLLQASDTQASITAAYAMLKRVQQRIGRVPCHLLVSARNAQRAEIVSRNIANAASRYLAMEVHVMGWLPEDEKLNQATRLSRTVLDAFPLSPSAQAFRRLAADLSGTDLGGSEAMLGEVLNEASNPQWEIDRV